MIWTRAEVERVSRAGSTENTPTRARILDRAWMLIDSADHSVVPHLLREGFWESWITTWFLNHLSSYHAFIDVGANQGYYSVLAASAGLPVLAFEPQPGLAKQLSMTAKEYDYRITVIPEGLSDRADVVTLWVPSELRGGASIMGDPTPGQGTTETRVRVGPLDDYGAWMLGRPLLIKIDAEGAEEAIWRGMQQMWAERECMVLLEWEWVRYADPVAFGKSLLQAARVSMVDYAGDEQPITDVSQLQHQDWITLVLRQHG